MSELKDDVRRHWQATPCGHPHARSAPGTREFFAEVDERRYRLEPFVPSFAAFERWRGRRVLEIGVGLGSDFVRFVRAGADATGVDLTQAAVELVRRRLELEGLAADLRVADAEALPFDDGSFDLVWSWGVLHHTPDTRRAVDEVRRVLRPDGEARLMLYSRRSFFAAGLWLRYALLRGRPWRSFADVIGKHLESPGTKAFTQAELERLFASFGSVDTMRFVTPYDRRVAGPLASLAGPRFGWFVGVVARR